MRTKRVTTYEEFTVTQQSDGSWIAQVKILTPKPFKLLFTSDSEDKARDTMQKYLDSEEATEDKLDLQGGRYY